MTVDSIPALKSWSTLQSGGDEGIHNNFAQLLQVEDKAKRLQLIRNNYTLEERGEIVNRMLEEYVCGFDDEEVILMMIESEPGAVLSLLNDNNKLARLILKLEDHNRDWVVKTTDFPKWTLEQVNHFTERLMPLLLNQAQADPDFELKLLAAAAQVVETSGSVQAEDRGRTLKTALEARMNQQRNVSIQGADNPNREIQPAKNVGPKLGGGKS